MFKALPDAAQPWLFPLVSVDGRAIDGLPPRTFCFVYFEYPAPLTFRIDEEDKLTLLSDAQRIAQNHDGDDPIAPPQRWRHSYITTMNVDVPDRRSPLSTWNVPTQILTGAARIRFARDEDALRFTYRGLVDHLARAQHPNSFPKMWPPSSTFFAAPEPLWTQSEQWPTDPSGEAMLFIGQVRADLLTDDAGTTTLFLFYSERHALVTQVAQSS